MTGGRVFALLACLWLVACGSSKPTTWAKPGATIDGYQKDNAECRQIARNDDGYAECMTKKGYLKGVKGRP
jgi:hypothetical protein